MTPRNEFLLLVASLLDDLTGSRTVSDTTLIQLHVLFGPMLVSALQLVDRREVVKVLLPGGRTVHQVTSSAGAPYTLYLDLPDVPSGVGNNGDNGKGKDGREKGVDDGKDGGLGVGLDNEGTDKAESNGIDVNDDTETRKGEDAPADDAQAQGSSSASSPSSPSSARSRLDTPSPPTPEPHPDAEAAKAATDPDTKDMTSRAEKQRRLLATAQSLGSMFCPCPGFAYNSLTGERNVFCKHILAVLLVHHLGRTLETRVGLAAVADLVGASSMSSL